MPAETKERRPEARAAANQSLDKIRTDVVGSLLRPQEWRVAREQYENGSLDKAAFEEIENKCIRDLVKLQEAVGLDVITDGEISRLNFQDSFGVSVGGFDAKREGISDHRKRSWEAEGASPLRRWDIPN